MADLKLYEEYREQRKPRPYWNGTMFDHTKAAQALRTVRYNVKMVELKARFKKAGGYRCYESEACGMPDSDYEPGRLRLVQCPDDCTRFDDLAGDTYNEEVNPDVPKHVMDAERKEYKRRIEQEGVWGFKAEVWDGDEWIESDSCWGFVGDDFEGSGYDGDFYTGALDALEKYQDQEARDYEETRPDMYQASKRRKFAATAFAAAMLGV